MTELDDSHFDYAVAALHRLDLPGRIFALIESLTPAEYQKFEHIFGHDLRPASLPAALQ